MRFNPSNRVMNDLLFLINLGFLAIIILILPYINPAAEQKLTDPPPQGNMVVQLFWETGADCDLDLWTQVPYKSGHDFPIGYSNKGSVTGNLLRDDLGSFADTTNRNNEVFYSKGLFDGEYRVNVHLYALKTCQLPVSARIEVGYKKTDDAPYQYLFYKNIVLTFPGQELTVMRWTMKDSALVTGSEHNTPIQLRGAGKGG